MIKMNLNLIVFIQQENLHKINDRTYVINLDEFKSIGTHWKALHVNRNYIIFPHIFGVVHIPIEIKRFIEKKDLITMIYRIQAHDLG